MRDDLGFCPIHFACASGCLPLVQLLVSPPYMADVSASARPGNGGADKGLTTPVAIAAIQGHEPVVEFLTAQGALQQAVPAPFGWAAWDDVLPPLAGCQGGGGSVPPAPLLPHFQCFADIRRRPISHRGPAQQQRPPAERRENMRRWFQRHFAEQKGAACPRAELPMMLPPASPPCSPYGSEAQSPGRQAALRARRGLMAMQVDTGSRAGSKEGSRAGSKERRPSDPNVAAAGKSVSVRTNSSVCLIHPEIATRSASEGDASAKTPPTRVACCIAWLPTARAR